MNACKIQRLPARPIRELLWLPLCLFGCQSPSSNVQPPSSILEARLEGPTEGGKRIIDSRSFESSEASVARLEVESDQQFTITYQPNPSENQAVVLSNGIVPNQNGWIYAPETDTMQCILMAGQLTWVENPSTSVKLRTDGLITKFEVSGFNGTGDVNVKAFKGTTLLFDVNVASQSASSGATQAVRMVEYSDNLQYVEITSNSEEIEVEVGGYLFP